MRRTDISERLRTASSAFSAFSPSQLRGRVQSIEGATIDVSGFGAAISVGERLRLISCSRQVAPIEVVGFRNGIARTMSFSSLDGVGPGSVVELYLCPGFRDRLNATKLMPCGHWLGRVIDPLGRPLDGGGLLPLGEQACSIRAVPPDATVRARLGPRLDLGVTVLDLFTTCRTGQRLGLFAGSGIGKSTLLAMLARQAACDVVVLALVGERGREVREFLEDDLGAEGLARSVVVVATSDASPLLRREAAYTAITVAEHFRDEGKSVLLLMDSLTRFCLALREIGLSAGEAPATRGYPPSVFAELPRLLERAGPGIERDGRTGFITGLFTVLVEGDDHNEPVADAVRGILDGHVVLDRRIGESGRYPAVDVLRSLSRTVPGCLTASEQKIADQARAILSTYADVADLVRLGAYQAGSDPAVDQAILLAPRIEAVLRQDRRTTIPTSGGFAALAAAMDERHA